jgi:hypothetical protein
MWHLEEQEVNYDFNISFLALDRKAKGPGDAGAFC